MPAYFLTNTDSDVAGKYVMHNYGTTSTILLVSLNAGGSTTIDFISPTFYPNNSSVTTTSASFELTFTVTDKNISVQPQIHRVNSAGTTQSSGTAATSQAVSSGTLSFTVDEPTWSTTCSDRIMLSLTFSNSAMNSRSVTMSLDEIGSYLLTSIPHNTNCSVLRKPVWVSYRK